MTHVVFILTPNQASDKKVEAPRSYEVAPNCVASCQALGMWVQPGETCTRVARIEDSRGWSGGGQGSPGLGSWQSKLQASSPHARAESVRTGAEVFPALRIELTCPGHQKPQGQSILWGATWAAGRTAGGPQGELRAGSLGWATRRA